MPRQKAALISSVLRVFLERNSSAALGAGVPLSGNNIGAPSVRRSGFVRDSVSMLIRHRVCSLLACPATTAPALTSYFKRAQPVGLGVQCLWYASVCDWLG